MARQRKIIAKNEAISGAFLMFSGAAFGASLAGAVASLIGYPFFVGAGAGAPWGVAVGTGAFFFQQITGRGFRLNFGGKKKRTHPSAFNSLVPWHVNEGIDEKGIMRWYDRRDKPPDEFMFTGTNNVYLPTTIPESMMFRFCERALQRNRIVLDPERTTYKRTGFKLRAHEVLSESYFTGKMSPRFLSDQYEAIKQILQMTGFWIDRRGGHSGALLVDFGMTPQKLVHRVRWGWIDIVVRANEQSKRLPWQ